jgi:predicted RNase H-like nuclease (RuvC/YqgF family)
VIEEDIKTLRRLAREQADPAAMEWFAQCAGRVEILAQERDAEIERLEAENDKLDGLNAALDLENKEQAKEIERLTKENRILRKLDEEWQVLVKKLETLDEKDDEIERLLDLLREWVVRYEEADLYGYGMCDRNLVEKTNITLAMTRTIAQERGVANCPSPLLTTGPATEGK